ncbi:MAG: hypothetical protein N2V75_02000 [Methanophagales archaeon]|nr:hypothetical protein [Methanophagales archaeon]
MKKWEIGVLIGFFAVFIILFFSVEQERPWEPKTSKVGEPIIIDDVHLDVGSVSVDDHLYIRFDDRNRETLGYRDYEAGAGWKFVILDIDIYVSKYANDSRNFYAGRIEDENGMTYDYYSLLEHNLEYYIPGGTPYIGIYRYENYINLPPGEGEFISIAYKMPTNAVPEKFHYRIHTQHGEVLFKK